LLRLEEGHVGAGIERGIQAVDRLIEAGDAARVRARDDKRVRIAPRRDRRTNARQEFLERNDLLAVEVAASRARSAFRSSPTRIPV